MKKISLFVCASLLGSALAYADEPAENKNLTNPTAAETVSLSSAAESGNTLNNNTTYTPLTAAYAKEYFAKHMSGNFDFTNNYVFRGISQTSNEMAVQGGMTFTWDSGIYANVWGSNVNFLTYLGNTATVEADTVVGYAKKFNDLGFDVHFVRYNYPRAAEANYNEGMASLTYLYFTGLVGYSPNVFNTHGPGTYVNLSANFPIPSKVVYFDNVSLSGGIGYYNLNSNAGNSYKDYNVMIQKAITDVYTIAFQWTDTDGNFNFPPYDGSHFVALFTANF